MVIRNYWRIKNSNVINIFIILFITVSCKTSVPFAYSSYSEKMLNNVISDNRELLDNSKLVLPIFLNDKKVEICIESGTFHHINLQNGLTLEESLDIMENCLKGICFKKSYTPVFQRYIINEEKYIKEFNNVKLENVLRAVVDSSFTEENGIFSKIKMSIKDEDYISRLTKYLILNHFSVSEGSYLGGYGVKDETLLGRLKSIK